MFNIVEYAISQKIFIWGFEGSERGNVSLTQLSTPVRGAYTRWIDPQLLALWQPGDVLVFLGLHPRPTVTAPHTWSWFPVYHLKSIIISSCPITCEEYQCFKKYIKQCLHKWSWRIPEAQCVWDWARSVWCSQHRSINLRLPSLLWCGGSFITVTVQKQAPATTSSPRRAPSSCRPLAKALFLGAPPARSVPEKEALLSFPLSAHSVYSVNSYFTEHIEEALEISQWVKATKLLLPSGAFILAAEKQAIHK